VGRCIFEKQKGRRRNEMQLAQDRERWQAFSDAVMNLGFHKNGEFPNWMKLIKDSVPLN